MDILKKLKTALKLKFCEVVDFRFLPIYIDVRFKLFEELGMEPPPLASDVVEEKEGTINLEEEMTTNPQIASWEHLHSHLATTIWTQKQASEFDKSEYIVSGIGAQQNDLGQSHIMVLLKDRFSGQQQPLPLSTLLHNFEPIEEVRPQEYH